MHVRIDEIGPEGRTMDEAVSEARLGETLAEAATGFGARSEAGVHLTLERAGSRIVVRGSLQGATFAACRRCLGETDVPVSAEFLLGLRPESERTAPGQAGEDREELGRGESAGSFRLEEADEDFYAGEEIDLWPLVREQLLLALPDYVLCKPDCKGLCTVCGNDLNRSECGCDRQVPDPRLSKLKDIKLS